MSGIPLTTTLPPVTMISSSRTYGLFLLTAYDRAQGDLVFETLGHRPTTTMNNSQFNYYHTTMYCMNGQVTTTIIRAVSQWPDTVQPSSCVALVNGTFFFDSINDTAFVNATAIEEIHDCSILPNDVAVFNTSISGSGIVSGDAFELDDQSILFPLNMYVYIFNDVKQFRIMCVYSAESPELLESPVPCAGSNIEFFGTLLDKLSSNILAVEMKHITVLLSPRIRPGATFVAEMSHLAE